MTDLWPKKHIKMFPCSVLRYIAFFTGSILAVFVILTVIDEDILQVEHVIGIMTVLTVITTVAKASVPDEVSSMTGWIGMAIITCHRLCLFLNYIEIDCFNLFYVMTHDIR